MKAITNQYSVFLIQGNSSTTHYITSYQNLVDMIIQVHNDHHGVESIKIYSAGQTKFKAISKKKILNMLCAQEIELIKDKCDYIIS
jgi:mRNA deadenylase 3'-5' endonuclease subunit Ccr4